MLKFLKVFCFPMNIPRLLRLFWIINPWIRHFQFFVIVWTISIGIIWYRTIRFRSMRLRNFPLINWIFLQWITCNQVLPMSFIWCHIWWFLWITCSWIQSWGIILGSTCSWIQCWGIILGYINNVNFLRWLSILKLF